MATIVVFCCYRLPPVVSRARDPAHGGRGRESAVELCVLHGGGRQPARTQPVHPGSGEYCTRRSDTPYRIHTNQPTGTLHTHTPVRLVRLFMFNRKTILCNV